jgi:hypothetical protein
MHRWALLLLLIAGYPAASQQILLFEKVQDFGKKQGPNRKHFSYAYLQIGLPSGQPMPGMASNANGQWSVGFISKYKIFNFLSIAGSSAYQHERYSYIPSDFRNNYFQFSSGLYDVSSASIRLNELEGALFARINLGKRGNHMGFYIDLGVQGFWLFGDKLKMRGYALGAGSVDTRQRQIGLKENTGYGYMTRVGWNKTSIFAKWRQTEIWHLPLPVFTMGIEFDLF